LLSSRLLFQSPWTMARPTAPPTFPARCEPGALVSAGSLGIISMPCRLSSHRRCRRYSHCSALAVAACDGSSSPSEHTKSDCLPHSMPAYGGGGSRHTRPDLSAAPPRPNPARSRHRVTGRVHSGLGGHGVAG
jgi:hypothetical protein